MSSALSVCVCRLTYELRHQVGAALSMVYKTKQPIVFVGTGQTYTKLKRPSAKDVVTKLLQGS